MKNKKSFVKKSRKTQRKEDRKAKKARKNEYFAKLKERNTAKKESKHSFKNSKFEEPTNTFQETKKTKSKKSLSLQDEQLQEVKKLKVKTEILKKEMDQERKKQFQKEAAADDLEIKKLEKYLKLNKMKEKSKLAFFASDGLDYLLDVCDRSKLNDAVEVEKRFKEEDDDFGDDLALVTGTPDVKKKSSKKKKMKPKEEINKSNSSDSEPEEQLSTKASFKLGNKKLPKKIKKNEVDSDLSNDDFESDDNLSDDNFSDSDIESDGSAEKPSNKRKQAVDQSEDEIPPNKKKKGAIKMDGVKEMKTKLKNDKNASEESDDDFLGNDDDFEEEESGGESQADEEQKKDKENGLWEDIYGRMRDKQGNVVAKYQPPHLRKKADDAGPNDEKLMRLKKQMKGLLNRLAENNIVNISSQIETLYSNNSRNDMNETLWHLYRESLLGEAASPERLMAEHAMLLAVLSANVGGEVSAHCLQKCVMEWHALWTAGAAVQDKTTNNALHLLSYMYHFKLFHCTLLYDILDLLLDKLEEKAIELVLLVLRTVGFSLRKDDPVRLKDFVLKSQKLANDTSGSEGSRVKFLLETILAIKNNNMSKIPNYNPEYAEQLKKTLKFSVRKGNYSAELKISLEDLLKADERGRWWVVGSAWTGELPGEKEPTSDNKIAKKGKTSEGFSSKLLDLAKKQRMNTDTRKTVFCILMSAEDYLDAFEKLLKLGLKGPSEREIMNVILHCLLQEKQFNPYYEHLARRFCVCDRRFQIMLQYAAWDRIQELKSLAPTQVTNFAKFLGNLMLEKNLALSVLKVVEFGEMDKPAVRFIRQILLSILLAENEEAMIGVFGRIAVSKPLKLFREGLRLFLHHFVLKNSKDVAGADMALLTTRVKLADSALSAADRSLAF